MKSAGYLALTSAGSALSLCRLTEYARLSASFIPHLGFGVLLFEALQALLIQALLVCDGHRLRLAQRLRLDGHRVHKLVVQPAPCPRVLLDNMKALLHIIVSISRSAFLWMATESTNSLYSLHHGPEFFQTT